MEIGDAGTGLRRPQLIDINQRLAAPSAIDVSVSRQMGLFVVGRLANRHGISVQLASPDGTGVTVTVALPKELVTTEAALRSRSDYFGLVASPDGSVNGAEEADTLYRPAAALDDQIHFADLVPSRPGLLDDPISLNGSVDDTPIFHAMLSRWFTEGTGTRARPRPRPKQSATRPKPRLRTGPAGNPRPMPDGWPLRPPASQLSTSSRRLDSRSADRKPSWYPAAPAPDR